MAPRWGWWHCHPPAGPSLVAGAMHLPCCYTGCLCGDKDGVLAGGKTQGMWGGRGDAPPSPADGDVPIRTEGVVLAQVKSTLSLLHVKGTQPHSLSRGGRSAAPTCHSFKGHMGAWCPPGSNDSLMTTEAETGSSCAGEWDVLVDMVTWSESRSTSLRGWRHLGHEGSGLTLCLGHLREKLSSVNKQPVGKREGM